MRWVLAGVFGVPAWFAVTVTAPLLFFDATHRWEEDPTVQPMLWWSVPAALLATTWLATRGAAPAPATLAASTLVALSLAVFHFVLPLRGEAPWPVVLAAGIAAALTGAALGRLRKPSRPSRRAARVAGVCAVLAGPLLLTATLESGAESSTLAYDEGRYGETGTVTLPRAGEYAILAVGFAAVRPDCTADGRPVDRVTIPPGGYGGDAAEYRWVARFRVGAAGPHEVICAPAADYYVVGDVPEIRGAVGRLIHWPTWVVWPAGALPGLAALVLVHRRPAVAGATAGRVGDR